MLYRFQLVLTIVCVKEDLFKLEIFKKVDVGLPHTPGMIGKEHQTAIIYGILEYKFIRTASMNIQAGLSTCTRGLQLLRLYGTYREYITSKIEYNYVYI